MGDNEETRENLETIRREAIAKTQEILQAYLAIDKALYSAQEHVADLLGTLKHMQETVQKSTREAERDLHYLMQTKASVSH